MDNKQDLIKRIEGIEMPDQSKKVIVDYILGHEFNDELIENVSKLLTTMADEADVMADHLAETIDTLDNLKNDLQDDIDGYLNDVDAVNEKYQDDVMESVSKIIDEAEAPAAPDAPMSAPVITEPVMPPVPDNGNASPLQEVSTPVMPEPTMPEPMTSTPVNNLYNMPTENVQPITGQTQTQEAPVMPWQQNPAGNQPTLQ